MCQLCFVGLKMPTFENGVYEMHIFFNDSVIFYV